MSIYIIILLFVVVVVAVVGGTAWFFFRFRRSSKDNKATGVTTKTEKLPFRWQYIMLPLIILFITAGIAAFFYPRLPAEVALQFRFDDSASRLLSREVMMALTLAPQAFLLLLGVGIIFLITKLGVLAKQNWSSRISPERVLWLMGNITAVPQGALCFTMFGIFYYNAYQTQFMPVWLFLIITLGISGLILGMFMVFTFLRIRQQPEVPSREIEDTNND